MNPIVVGLRALSIDISSKDAGKHENRVALLLVCMVSRIHGAFQKPSETSQRLVLCVT